MKSKAIVFNIERYATEDGPGIRTVVFLKGCDLRCKWCSNPESQQFGPEVLLNANVCHECGRCKDICPQKAISYKTNFGFITDNTLCKICSVCVDGCYYNARSISGVEYTADLLVEQLLKDKKYYLTSGGGVTFSGGEPLLQYEFINDCAKLLKPHGIPILVETCGHVDIDFIKNSVDNISEIFYDFKHINPSEHKKLTGSDNILILNNLIWLNKNYKGSLSIRYPYIPGCNDNIADIEEFLKFVSTLKNVSEVWFLPYHRLGLPKYQGLGREYEIGNLKSLKFSNVEFLKKYAKKYDLIIKV